MPMYDATTEEKTAYSITDLFRQQVELSPSKVALVSGERTITFSELDRLSADVASFLSDIGVAADTPVGIFADPSVDLIIGIWGILRSGGAYLPLSPDYPQARLAYMIQDSGVRLVLCQKELKPALAALITPDVRIITLQEAEEARSGASCTRASVLRRPAPTDLAYIIYTSGSTGKPKGVMIEHRNIANQMRWLRDHCGIGCGSTVLQKTPASFDAAQWEILSPCCGSRVVVVGAGSHRDPERLINAIRTHDVTELQCVPTLLQALLDTDGFGTCSSLQKIFSGGEILSRKLAKKLNETLPGCQLVNLYGPTECTINSSAYFVDFENLDSFPSSIPIGKPVSNTGFVILNPEGKLAAPEEIGELYIGGIQVARGYLNRPDLSAERFVPAPLPECGTAGPLYRTGDLAYWNADGTVQFVGRADSQVKLRGFRIELDEIRTVIEAHEWVKTAAVLVKESPRTGLQNLIACIELSPRQAILMDQGKHGNHHVTKRDKSQVKAQLSANGCREDDDLAGRTAVPLPGRTPNNAQQSLAFSRKTYRCYEGGNVTRADILRMLERPAATARSRDLTTITLLEIGELLRYFGPFDSDERLLPKYTYASPGALYATQLYIEVRNLAGLDSGLYYFHPLLHRLFLIAPVEAGPPHLALHIVGNKRAIYSVYSTNIQEILEMEAGHMLGVFDRILPAYGLSIVDGRYDRNIGKLLAGTDDDHYIGSFVIGTGAVDAPGTVDLYVQAHPDRIPDLPAGSYRYTSGNLVRISGHTVLKNHVVAINQQVYERASFGVTMVSRGEQPWMQYVSLGRELQRLQMNDVNLGLMSSGYSSKSGHDLPLAQPMTNMLGEKPDAFYFCIGGRISLEQIASRGMKEDAVHMSGPTELVKQDLRSMLPDYMVPNRIIIMDSLPLTSNGKVDVAALRNLTDIDPEITDRVEVGPRTETEEKICSIWKALTRQDSLSICDDFFEIGGNSLTAVALINQVNRAFGSRLPVQVLFECPTVEHLAKCVESEMSDVRSRLVCLSPAQGDRPVFCWPGLGGYPLSLRTLALELNLERSFYGVQTHGINAGEEPFATVTEMAKHDVDLIRRLQPEGPYTLCGYSFGARVAFEVAFQLEQSGAEVDNLLLIAPGSPRVDLEGKNETSAGPVYLDRTFVTILFSVFSQAISGPLRDDCLKRTRDEESFIAFICEHFPQLEPEQVRRITRVVRMTYEPTYSFTELVGRRLDAPVTVFKALGDNYSFIETQDGYARQQTAVLLTEDHYSILKMPYVRELAYRIRQRLDLAVPREVAKPLARIAN